MTLRYVSLPGPITLIPSKNLHADMARLVNKHPTLRLPRNPGELLGELHSRPDGVAAAFSEPKRGGDDWSILLYLPTFTLRLFLTKGYQDAYMVGAIGLMRIHDHQRLAEGALLIRPSGWRMALDVQSIPRPSASYWKPLVAEWGRLGEDLAARRGAPVLTEEQAAFLDTVDRMIDADERITAEAARTAPLFPYRSVDAAGERREGTRQYYRFRLAGDQAPDERAFVRVHGASDLRGQVARVARGVVTVRFDHPVDWERFAASPEGQLELTSSQVVHAKQREAVALLRSRRACNTTLLPALVAGGGGRLPQVPAVEVDGLDADQSEALQKGLATQDVLAVHGPPGTGKTRVISQLAHAARTGRGERVLVTSHTNRAVDNVLARLPKDLRVIRVGNSDFVTAEGKPYLLERQVDEVRDRVLGEAERAAGRYERLQDAGRWTDELDAALAKLDAAREEEIQAGIRLDQARRAAGSGVQLRVDELAAGLDACDRAIDRLRRRMERRGERIRWTAAHTAMPLLGVLLGWLGELWRRRQEAAGQRAEHLREEHRLAGEALAEAERELDVTTRDQPAVRQARGAVHAALGRRDALRPAVQKAAREARLATATVKAPPPVRKDAGADALERDAKALLGWLRVNLGPLRRRAALLAEWRADVARETEPLSSELVRYADVVAATCIGAGSRRELADLDFDLAIVDEAGQIGVANALVPLVRARRGVLVGDDRQLPPYLDSEVEEWGRSVEDPLVRELLATSALERLSGGEVVRLTGQRRMPAAIADFVSAAFYGGRLQTKVRREHRDALFGRPLAFVDTARLPEAERYEQPAGGRGESWGRSGYVNPAEAALLVELAVHYERVGAGWAVIVPYRSQARQIARSVAHGIGDTEKAALNVGTVDSFQGGEREVILYGFTRSNEAGRVGFLKELRRANVAFTRAQFQLVLVGDLTTLTAARDRGFRELAVALRAHTARHGEIRQYRDIHAQVTRLNEEEGRA
ncbi:DEAD/DEAH box helicase [Actinomadura luteofluorescens]|uniref:DEAD/DEAH box helicase n=1 Tax=Actinomadura luteofluorescens TaxID=46163 RepID=UPI0030D06138